MTYANPQTAGQTAGTNNPGMNPSEAMNQAPSAGFVAGGVGGGQATQLSDYKIIRRNGSVVAFEPSKIAIAVTIVMPFIIIYIIKIMCKKNIIKSHPFLRMVLFIFY